MRHRGLFVRGGHWALRALLELLALRVVRANYAGTAKRVR